MCSGEKNSNIIRQFCDIFRILLGDDTQESLKNELEGDA